MSITVEKRDRFRTTVKTDVKRRAGSRRTAEDFFHAKADQVFFGGPNKRSRRTGRIAVLRINTQKTNLARCRVQTVSIGRRAQSRVNVSYRMFPLEGEHDGPEIEKAGPENLHLERFMGKRKEILPKSAIFTTGPKVEKMRDVFVSKGSYCQGGEHDTDNREGGRDR